MIAGEHTRLTYGITTASGGVEHIVARLRAGHQKRNDRPNRNTEA